MLLSTEKNSNMKERRNSYSNLSLERHYDFLIQKKNSFSNLVLHTFMLKKMSALKGSWFFDNLIIHIKLIFTSTLYSLILKKSHFHKLPTNFPSHHLITRLSRLCCPYKAYLHYQIVLFLIIFTFIYYHFWHFITERRLFKNVHY